MPSLSEHHSGSLVKIMLIGDSSTGKTGALASLVTEGGYKLRVLDTDNGLDSLKYYIRYKKEGNEYVLRPDADALLAKVDFETQRDKLKAGDAGPTIPSPRAFVNSLKLMEKWSDGSDPAAWGSETIFVLDSLSSFGKAAFEWARAMNPLAKDPRQWYFSAQGAVENTIGLLTSEAFHTNLIVISHVNWKEMQDGTTKGYPNAVGSALGPIIARYFNTLILAETSGFGKNVGRKIKTIPTGSIDLKSASPKVEAELPLNTGLSTIFNTLKSKET